MQKVGNNVLYEELEVFSSSCNTRALADLLAQKHRTLEFGDRGGLFVSPEGASFAILDTTGTCLTILRARDEQGAVTANGQPQSDLAPFVVVRSFQPTSISGSRLSQADTIISLCWSADGSRLAVACASGHIYVLDRTGRPVAMLPPAPGTPWLGKAVGALALPSPALLLLLTAQPPQLFAVPLATAGPGPAGPGAGPSRASSATALRPLPASAALAKLHGIIHTAVYDARSATLVVAGDAAGAAAPAAAAAGAAVAPLVSISAWQVALQEASSGSSGPGVAAPAIKLTQLGSYAGPLGFGGAAAGVVGGGGSSWFRSRWSLALSPLCEHVALTAPPYGGLLLLSLPYCQRMDAGEKFGGRTAPPASAFRATLERSVHSALSASWWAVESALAVSDLGGAVGLAALPGYDNLLGGHGEEPARFAPGSLIASKIDGPGPRALLVLEPVRPGSGSEAGDAAYAAASAALAPAAAAAAAARGLRGAAAAAAADAALKAVASAPGLRVLLLAERTPQQMLQVHLRNQQWGRALELCASAGLDPDTVYKARWALRPVDAANIADNLAKIGNRRWVVAECCRRVASDYEGQRKLINYGLREAARQAKPPTADDADEASSSSSNPATPQRPGAPGTPATGRGPPRGVSGGGASSAGGADGPLTLQQQAWWWCVRLRLWRLSDRLEVLYAAQGRTFDSAAFSAFRDLPLSAAAGSWAAVGAVGPLAVMTQHYPAALAGPVLLGVLVRLPETINPRLYGALLPRADADDPPTPPRAPSRKLDWVEQPDLVLELRSRAVLLTPSAVAGTAVTTSGPMDPELDPEATDAVVRILDPRPRLSATAVSEWYADRALQLDERAGQLQGALTLLELGWERGARGPRVAQLLGAARALAGVVGATGAHGAAAAATGASGASGSRVPAVWRVGLGEFVALPGVEQLRLLLAGSRAESLREDLRERVAPFLHGPGADPAAVAAMLGDLLEDELRRRPAWVAELVGCEAAERTLFASTGALVQAVTRAVLSCPHTDEWPALVRLLGAAEEAVVAEQAAPAGGDRSSGGGGSLLASLGELRGFVKAGTLLAAHGLPLTVRHISTCSREEAARCVRQVLGRVQRTSPSMPAAAWADLWADLQTVRRSAFPGLLESAQLLSEVARCLLHCGRTDLANAYLRSGPPGGDTPPLEPEAADALIASAAAEMLAGANDPYDDAVQQATACLALASLDSPPARALIRLVSALQMLPYMGLDVIPAQVMQMHDRFEVIRMILEGADAATTAVAGGGLYGIGDGRSVTAAQSLGMAAAAAASAALGGRFSRRRAAVRAAGKAAAAGSRAAAALAGGLLAVAGRVAPNVAGAVAGRVADAVAGAVSAAAAAAAAAPAAAAAGGVVQPPYKQVGRLLELAELLGLEAPGDELRVRDLAGRAALQAGDVDAAQHLATALMAAGYVPAWSLCADVAVAKGFRDDAVRQRLLSYALLHCPPDRMTRLLEGLRTAERKAASAAGAGTIAPAGASTTTAAAYEASDPRVEAPDCYLRGALVSIPAAAGAAAGSGGIGTSDPISGSGPVLPSLGDTHLALAILSPGCPPSADVATAVLHNLPDDGGLSYAQLQRVVTLECYCHCLRVLLPLAPLSGTAGGGGGTASSTERLALMQQPLSKLLDRVRPMATANSAGSADAAAAVAAAARLAAARDSRAVRQHVPGVDAARFCGDSAYRREAILRQAALAGATASASPTSSPPKAAVQLLDQARRLAASYDVDTWDVELHYTCSLVTAAPAVTPELRSAVQSHEATLLRRPRPLLAHLASAVYPELPPASGPHLALWLAVVTDCLHACAKDDPSAAALAAAAAPSLDKLRELLDKAAAALKGLALTPVHAPLLAAMLAPLGANLRAAVPGPAPPPPPPPVAAAAAAIFSYIKPTNLPQAVKLIAALHKLLGPLAKKTAASPPAPHLLVPELQAALDALPPYLPYLALCVKAVGTKGLVSQQQPQRDMPAAWAHVEDHAVRLPARVLASWLAFLLLPGSGCPLEARVTGGVPLQPCSCPLDLSVTILDACMPRLLAAASAPSASSTAQGTANAAAAAPDPAPAPALLGRLQALHRHLRTVSLVRHYAAEGVLDEQLAAQLESLLPDSSAAAASASLTARDDVDTLRSALVTLAASGCPAAVLLEIAGAAAPPPPAAPAQPEDGADLSSSASDTPSSSALSVIVLAVRDAVSDALERLRQEAAAAAEAAAGGGDGAISSSWLTQLRLVLRCLDQQPPSHPHPQPGPGPHASAAATEPPSSDAAACDAANGSSTAAAAGPAAAVAAAPAVVVEEVVGEGRSIVWQLLQQFSDDWLPALEAAGPAGVAAAGQLLDLQAALGTKAMWPGWFDCLPPGAEAQKRRLTLLVTRTRALIAHLPAGPATHGSHESHQLPGAAAGTVRPVVSEEDVQAPYAAEHFFLRLLRSLTEGVGAQGSHGKGKGAVPMRVEEAEGEGGGHLAALRLLARLLSEVWRDGEVWNEEEGGKEGKQQQQEVERVPAHAGRAEAQRVSRLRNCWRELALAMLGGGYLADVVRLLDPPASREAPANGTIASGAPHPGNGTNGSGQPLPAHGDASRSETHTRLLSADDVQYILETGCASETIPSDGDRQLTAWCIGLASPYDEQRQRALVQLVAEPPPHFIAINGGASRSRRTAVAATLLLSYLVRSGNAVRLVDGGAAAGRSIVHPLLTQLVALAPATAAEAQKVVTAAATAPEPLTAALPCLAALLAERRLYSIAGALVARRLRLHPSLAAAGGCTKLLERYLHSAVRSAAGGGGDGTATSAAGLEAWPGAVGQLWAGQRERCQIALKQLAADNAQS